MSDPSSTATAQLDQLAEQALAASRAGRTDQSLALWRQCVALHHELPRVHYLLGAEYAQARQYEHAVVHLSIAVEQDPAFAAARLQLGLLWLTLKAPRHAEQALAPLSQLPHDSAWFHFGAGLVALARGEVPAAEAKLADGLALPFDNAPLQADMQRLLASLRADRGSATPQAQPELGLAMSAYNNTRH
ncbi:hypothetical protein [Rhizobacter sp. P5_C2]